jgi:RibD C-terminal domain
MGMGLVDEVRLMVYPAVLGAGDRLFGETQDKIPLRLVESRPFVEGVVNMIYLRRILRQSLTSAPRSVRPHRLASEQQRLPLRAMSGRRG